MFGSRTVHAKLNELFSRKNLVISSHLLRQLVNLSVLFNSDFFPSLAMSGIPFTACFVHMRDLTRLRGYLTQDAVILLEMLWL